MPGPPPEHPQLRLLKGNPGKRPARSLPEPTRSEQCPELWRTLDKTSLQLTHWMRPAEIDVDASDLLPKC
jgi:hypothetical protein